MSNIAPPLTNPLIENDYFYLSSDGTYYIVGDGDLTCSGAPFEINGHLDIPAEYNGKPVKEIEDWAFGWSSKLTYVSIPNSVTLIGYGTFYGCESLTSITIGNGVTSIGRSTFRFCSKLTSINIDPANTVYKSIGNCLIEIATNKLIQGCSTSIIPDHVTSIGEGAFEGYSALTSVTIPDSVTSIDYYAFQDCSALTSIVIPNSVTSINRYAFSSCSTLTTVIIKGKPTVSSNIFYNTSKLEKIYVIEGQGYSPTDTISEKPIEILPADGAVVAKTMTVKSMKIS